MKKTYINPEMEVVKLQTMQMLAASVTVSLEDEVVNDITFSGREDNYDFE